MRIKSKKSIKAILKLLSEPDSLEILKCTKDNPMAANEILLITGIPYSTLYKKVRWMLKNEFLFIPKRDFSQGKKFALLQSKVLSVKVEYENDQLLIDLQEK